MQPEIVFNCIVEGFQPMGNCACHISRQSFIDLILLEWQLVTHMPHAETISIIDNIILQYMMMILK